jgi:CBS domain containing-hemolysin-like protein
MTPSETLLMMMALVVGSSFFSVSEIALAAARKPRLQQLSSKGDTRATHVLHLQESPGNFFTVVQIGLNAVAILGGIIGESFFSPYLAVPLSLVLPEPWLGMTAFAASVFLVTALFILFADLIPKRIAMIAPEYIALTVAKPMLVLITVFKPLVWFFNGLADLFFRLLRLPTMRDNDVTSGDIMAMMDAGAQAGVLQEHERYLLENVFEMESRTVTSAMTARENLVFFLHDEPLESIQQKLIEHPHSRFLVCKEVLDKVIGGVDSRDLLLQLLKDQSLNINTRGLVRPLTMIPDTLNLYEVLEQFKSTGSDFAVVMNEYALVVGVVTLKDVMSIVMGELVVGEEEQIVKRDQDSWLIDGLTPLQDVMRVLEIESFPETENYETISGFMMFMLRKIPKRTDFVSYAGFKFEVVDIEDYKINQLLVSRLPADDPTGSD